MTWRACLSLSLLVACAAVAAAPVGVGDSPSLQGAQGVSSAGGLAAAPQGACVGHAAPPCGYINPILDLAFPDKPACAAGGDVDLSACIPLPADGGSVRFAGTVRWYWKESEDLTYPPDAQSPIEISFATIANNPSWLTFQVDPPTYTISAADLVDPRNSKVDDSGPSPLLYYWYERPINVTFTRSGAPDAAGAAALANRDGLLELYVRTKSTPSGTTFNAAFGGEYFRFNATSLVVPAGAAKASPPMGAMVGAIAVGAAAVTARTQRRRRAGP